MTDLCYEQYSIFVQIIGGGGGWHGPHAPPIPTALQSDFITVSFGVPQCSLLGLTLFLIFINDLPIFLNKCSSVLYADDTTIHKTITTLISLNTTCKLNLINYALK